MPNNTVMLVDDETKVTETAGRFLKTKGLEVLRADSSAEALRLAAQNAPEVVLMDIRMPGMDGVACLREMKRLYPDIEVIMATAVSELDVGIACMQAGAFGYILKPVDLHAAYAEINKALEHRRLILQVKEYQSGLEDKVEKRTQEILLLNSQLKDNFLKSVRMLIGLLEAYDPFIGGHLRRVAALVREMGARLQLSPKEMLDLELAALLHDIGTMTLPRRLKDSKYPNLSREEIVFVTQQTVFTQSILSPMKELDPAGKIIRSHLERLDGEGFPDGLTEEKIPLGSKILGVANAFDEINSRRRFTEETFKTDEEKEDFAINYLFNATGRHFSWVIVDTLKRSVEKMNLRARQVTKVRLNDIKPGMTIAEDIYTKDGTLLLAKGYTLEKGIIYQLSKFCGLNLLEHYFMVYSRGS